jgi:uncharacterized protein
MQIRNYISNMHYFNRYLEKPVSDRLLSFPSVAILGPRQCGKSTLARHILKTFQNSIYLDLELPSDLNKIREPELFFKLHSDKLICLDEIQRSPELFTVLRSFIDKNQKNGRFLILGSASRDLIRQTSETLAGRISYVELSPFMATECSKDDAFDLNHLWLRGGFPRSFLAENDQISYLWRHDFIRSFVERDVLQIQSGASTEKVDRLLRMCAHSNGQTVNYSKLGSSLDMSDNTVRHYLEILSGGFLLRILRPYFSNAKRRLIKAPKVYVRDSGILHAVLGIETFEHLLGSPEFGTSWEGLVIENVLSSIKPSVSASFYRTANGEEADLVLENGNSRIIIECKASSSPQAGRSLLYAIKELTPRHSWIISPIESAYQISELITASSLPEFLSDNRIRNYLL